MRLCEVNIDPCWNGSTSETSVRLWLNPHSPTLSLAACWKFSLLLHGHGWCVRWCKLIDGEGWGGCELLADDVYCAQVSCGQSSSRTAWSPLCEIAHVSTQFSSPYLCFTTASPANKEGSVGFHCLLIGILLWPEIDGLLTVLQETAMKGDKVH